MRKLKNKEKKEEKNVPIEETNKKNTKVFTKKGILFFVLFAIVGGVFFPYILTLFGLSNKIATTVGNVLITSFGYVYSKRIISSKEKFTLAFFKEYAFMAVIFGAISYLWLGFAESKIK